MTYTERPVYRRCQTLFDRQYPKFRNAGEQYRDLVAAAVRPDSRLLDVGCGRISLAVDAIGVIGATGVTVGIDLSFEDLKFNETVQFRAGANATGLPFPDAYFDVLISQWVVEHFEQPRESFAEMARVLKPGGKLIFMTTNLRNYVPFLSRLVPEGARKFALNKLLRRPSHESFPTFYRANSQRALNRLGGQTGLRVEQCVYVGNPFYFAFSVPLFRLALGFERITDARALQSLKLYLLAVMVRE